LEILQLLKDKGGLDYLRVSRQVQDELDFLYPVAEDRRDKRTGKVLAVFLFFLAVMYGGLAFVSFRDGDSVLGVVFSILCVFMLIPIKSYWSARSVRSLRIALDAMFRRK